MHTWTMDGEWTYLDTSGILAYMDADDRCHDQALQAWREVISGSSRFLMTEYVRLECWSLIQRRLGIDAVRDFYQTILPLCTVESVDENLFDLLARQVLLTGLRQLSLVDLSSFECMQRRGLQRALAFYGDFADRGFATPGTAGW